MLRDNASCRSRTDNKTSASRGRWTTDLHTTTFIAIVCVLVIALFAFRHRAPRRVNWSFVPGTIHDTRIVADHGLETKWGGQITWKAEYKLGYIVADREYAIWADSGIRGESEAEVRLALPNSPLPCQVKYNPRRPEESVADCRSKRNGPS